MSWRYTYVTTNLAENVVLSQHIILAMMATQVNHVILPPFESQEQALTKFVSF